ncbi:MAG: hypothetical protein ACYDBJ_11915, partial [Aggregatilineales bacterium]
TNGRGDDLTGHPVQIGNEGLGVMPDILAFNPCYLAGFHRPGRLFAFERVRSRLYEAFVRLSRAQVVPPVHFRPESSPFCRAAHRRLIAK